MSSFLPHRRRSDSRVTGWDSARRMGRRGFMGQRGRISDIGPRIHDTDSRSHGDRPGYSDSARVNKVGRNKSFQLARLGQNRAQAHRSDLSGKSEKFNRYRHDIRRSSDEDHRMNIGNERRRVEEESVNQRDLETSSRVHDVTRDRRISDDSGAVLSADRGFESRQFSIQTSHQELIHESVVRDQKPQKLSSAIGDKFSNQGTSRKRSFEISNRSDYPNEQRDLVKLSPSHNTKRKNLNMSDSVSHSKRSSCTSEEVKQRSTEVEERANRREESAERRTIKINRSLSNQGTDRDRVTGQCVRDERIRQTQDGRAQGSAAARRVSMDQESWSRDESRGKHESLDKREAWDKYDSRGKPESQDWRDSWDKYDARGRRDSGDNLAPLVRRDSWGRCESRDKRASWDKYDARGRRDSGDKREPQVRRDSRGKRESCDSPVQDSHGDSDERMSSFIDTNQHKNYSSVLKGTRKYSSSEEEEEENGNTREAHNPRGSVIVKKSKPIHARPLVKQTSREKLRSSSSFVQEMALVIQDTRERRNRMEEEEESKNSVLPFGDKDERLNSRVQAKRAKYSDEDDRILPIVPYSQSSTDGDSFSDRISAISKETITNIKQNSSTKLVKQTMMNRKQNPSSLPMKNLSGSSSVVIPKQIRSVIQQTGGADCNAAGNKLINDLPPLYHIDASGNKLSVKCERGRGIVKSGRNAKSRSPVSHTDAREQINLTREENVLSDTGSPDDRARPVKTLKDEYRAVSSSVRSVERNVYDKSVQQQRVSDVEQRGRAQVRSVASSIQGSGRVRSNSNDHVLKSRPESPNKSISSDRTAQRANLSLSSTVRSLQWSTPAAIRDRSLDDRSVIRGSVGNSATETPSAAINAERNTNRPSTGVTSVVSAGKTSRTSSIDRPAVNSSIVRPGNKQCNNSDMSLDRSVEGSKTNIVFKNVVNVRPSAISTTSKPQITSPSSVTPSSKFDSTAFSSSNPVVDSRRAVVRTQVTTASPLSPSTSISSQHVAVLSSKPAAVSAKSSVSTSKSSARASHVTSAQTTTVPCSSIVADRDQKSRSVSSLVRVPLSTSNIRTSTLSIPASVARVSTKSGNTIISVPTFKSPALASDVRSAAVKSSSVVGKEEAISSTVSRSTAQAAVSPKSAAVIRNMSSDAAVTQSKAAAVSSGQSNSLAVVLSQPKSVAAAINNKSPAVPKLTSTSIAQAKSVITPAALSKSPVAALPMPKSSATSLDITKVAAGAPAPVKSPGASLALSNSQGTVQKSAQKVSYTAIAPTKPSAVSLTTPKSTATPSAQAKSTATTLISPKASTATPLAASKASAATPLAAPKTSAATPLVAPKASAATPLAAPKISAATPLAAPKASTATPLAAPKSVAATPLAAPKSTAATPLAAPKTSAATPLAAPKALAATPLAASKASAATPLAAPKSTAATLIASPKASAVSLISPKSAAAQLASTAPLSSSKLSPASLTLTKVSATPLASAKSTAAVTLAKSSTTSVASAAPLAPDKALPALVNADKSISSTSALTKSADSTVVAVKSLTTSAAVAKSSTVVNSSAASITLSKPSFVNTANSSAAAAASITVAKPTSVNAVSSAAASVTAVKSLDTSSVKTSTASDKSVSVSSSVVLRAEASQVQSSSASSNIIKSVTQSKTIATHGIVLSAGLSSLSRSQREAWLNDEDDDDDDDDDDDGKMRSRRRYDKRKITRDRADIQKSLEAMNKSANTQSAAELSSDKNTNTSSDMSTDEKKELAKRSTDRSSSSTSVSRKPSDRGPYRSSGFTSRPDRFRAGGSSLRYGRGVARGGARPVTSLMDRSLVERRRSQYSSNPPSRRR